MSKIALMMLLLFPKIAFAHAGHSVPSTNFEKTSKRAKVQRLTKQGKDAHAHGGGKRIWSLSLGMSVTGTYSAGSSTAASSSAAVPRLSDEGHEHGGGAPAGEGGAENDDGQGGEAGISLSPSMEVVGGVVVYDPVIVTASQAYTFGKGINDPTLGLAAGFSLTHHITLPASLGFSIPISTPSRANYKITTMTATAGVRDAGHTWTKGVTFLTAQSWYSKTVFYVEPFEPELSGAVGPVLANDTEEQTKANASVAKREFSRYGVNGDLLYQFSSMFTFGSAASLTLIVHQFDPTSWLTDVTLIKASMQYVGLISSLGVAISREAKTVPLPDTPRATLAAKYEF